MNSPTYLDPLERAGRLAALARLEQAPTGHVARQVIRRIRQRSAPSLTRPLTLFAAIAAGAAVGALVLIAVGLGASAGDPLGAFFQVASMSSI
jgi:hypothetical protein